MNAALLLSLALWTAPARAAQAPANVPAKDQLPDPNSQGADAMYGAADIEADLRAELTRRESDREDALKQLDAELEAQKALETRQLKEKFDLLKTQRDARAAYEQSEIDAWKKFSEKLRALEPEKRGAEKAAYDQRALTRFHKQAEDAQAQSRRLMEKQQRERDEFWAKRKKEEDERARRQVETAKAFKKPD